MKKGVRDLVSNNDMDDQELVLGREEQIQQKMERPGEIKLLNTRRRKRNGCIY